MAKTLSDIKNQIYAYLPQVNSSSKDTLLSNSINLAVERISRAHDWTQFKPYTPVEKVLSEGAYYLSKSDFSFTRFQSIRLMYWRKSSGEDYGKIKFLDDETFLERYGYIDYSDRSKSYPVNYTIQGTRYVFNCPATEDLTIRVYYQQYHPYLTADESELEFEPEYLGFQTIALYSLLELKNSLTGLEFPQELSIITQLAPQYLAELILADKKNDSEELELGTLETDRTDPLTDNFGWPI